MQVLIKGENKRKLHAENQSIKQCSCPKKAECSLGGECLSKDIVYQAIATSDNKTETYFRLTATAFKSGLENHRASLKSKSKCNATELSKYIWQLKESNCNHFLNWKTLCYA